MITIGQQWVSPNGVTYTIKGKLRHGWEVTISSDDGVVTASVGTFRYHDHKFRGLIGASNLKLYDPSDALDLIAERLERKGKPTLAAAVDAISQEFVGARRPAQVTRDRKEEMEEQVDVIIDSIEDADDPENIEGLQEELEDTLEDLEDVEDTVSPPNDVKPTDTVRKTENISKWDPHDQRDHRNLDQS